MKVRAGFTASFFFLTAVCFAAEPSISGAISVTEYEVTLPMRNAEESLGNCETFDNAEKKIETFFAVAARVAEAPKFNRTKVCVVTGVAKTSAGSTVDFEIVGGTYGTLSYGGRIQWFICAKGSRCCEVLSSICNKAP